MSPRNKLWTGAALLALLLGSGLPYHIELAALNIYRRASPVLTPGIHCRFRPTCSAYARSVLRREGFWAGNWLIAKRLARCSPAGWLVDSLQPVGAAKEYPHRGRRDG